MKIICTKKEKESLTMTICASRNCFLPYKCPNGYDCKKCLEERIEWEVTDDERGKG